MSCSYNALFQTQDRSRASVAQLGGHGDSNTPLNPVVG